MGKGSRNRRRAGQSGGTRHRAVNERFSWRTPPPYAARGNTPEALQMAAMVADAYVMPCRATYLDDPVLADVVGPALLAADDHGAEAMPVLLFEPTSLLAVQDTQTGTTREMRTEALVSGGLHRMSSSRLLGAPADGWSVGRAEGRVKLRDPDGAVVVEGDLDLDPAWVSRAVSHRRVAVLHGSPLGVKVPAGKTAHSYTIRERAEEGFSVVGFGCDAVAGRFDHGCCVTAAWRVGRAGQVDWNGRAGTATGPGGCRGDSPPAARLPASNRPTCSAGRHQGGGCRYGVDWQPGHRKDAPSGRCGP
jgi:hypothetical protein